MPSSVKRSIRISGQSVIVAIRATTGRLSLSTTALTLIDLNVSGTSCMGSNSRLRGTSLSYLKIRICAPCSFHENKRWFPRLPIAQRRSPPNLKRVGQRNFFAQRRDVSIRFLLGQVLLEQSWLVRLDRECAQGNSLSPAHRARQAIGKFVVGHRRVPFHHLIPF